MKKNYKTGIALAVLLIFVPSMAYSQQYREAGRAGHASPAKTVWRKNMQRMSKIHFGRNVPTAKTAARATTEMAERLTGLSDYDYYGPDTMMGVTLGLSDSSVYQYSGTRSSAFDYNLMIFDPTFYFGGEVIMGVGGSLGSRDANNAPAMLFDSMWMYSNGSYYSYFPDSFALSDEQYALYDTNNNVIDWADLGVPDSLYSYSENRYINYYDISGNLAICYNLSWNFGYWDTAEMTTYSYNIENEVIQDSSYVYYGGGIWQLWEEYVYSFDDSGNMIHADYYDDSEGVWQYSQQYFMRYNSSNQITWDSAAQFAGSWMPQVSDTYGYTPGVNYMTYECLFNLEGGIPASYLYRTKHVTGGLPDTLYQWEMYYGDSVLIDGAKYSFTYDTYNEPVLENTYVLNIDTPYYTTGSYDTTIDYITHFYYQVFAERQPGSKTAASAKITIYPNPTNDGLSIYRPGVNNGVYTFVRLVNASGQTVLTEAVPWYSETESISVRGLVPGVYWLVITDKNGNGLLKQAVVVND
jgi:hypothetical protein